MPQSLVGHLRVHEPQLLQVQQAREVFQSLVSDFSGGKVEILEMRQRLEVL